MCLITDIIYCGGSYEVHPTNDPAYPWLVYIQDSQKVFSHHKTKREAIDTATELNTP